MFPEDVWIQIKAFLLVKVDPLLLKEVKDFQFENGVPGPKIQYHLYYRLIRIEASELLMKVLAIMEESFNIISDCSLHVTENDEYYETHEVDDDDLTWVLFEQDEEIAWKNTEVIRLGNRFLDVYEMSSTTELLKIIYAMKKYIHMYSRENIEYVEIQFRILHEERKRTPQGCIKYIWETSDERQIETIQKMCCLPINIVKKKGRQFVIVYHNGENSFWTSPLQVKKQGYIATRSREFSMDTSICKYCHFKCLLDMLGYPIKNVYKKLK